MCAAVILLWCCDEGVCDQVITFDGSGVVMKVSVMQVITFDGSGVVIKVSVMQVIKSVVQVL